MKTAYIAKQRQISFVKSHFSRQLEERILPPFCCLIIGNRTQEYT